MIAGLVRSMRPSQALKNGLVLIALFFTVNKWWDPDEIAGMARLVGTSVAATLIFVMISAAVYLVNDAMDVKRDRAHPVKRERPIASGVVPLQLAWTVGVVLFAAGIGLSFLLKWEFGAIVVAYVVTSQAYNLAFKNVVLLDVAVVATGFVLRAAAGSLAIDGFSFGSADHLTVLELTISPWLYVCTGSGALFIALGKRRGELLGAGDRAGEQRPILAEYSIDFIDKLLAVVAPTALIAYILYTFSGSFVADVNLPNNNSMMLTIPFVAYGLFRYMYLIHQRGQGEQPDELLVRDKPLAVTVLLWLATAAAVLMVNAGNG